MLTSLPCHLRRRFRLPGQRENFCNSVRTSAVRALLNSENYLSSLWPLDRQHSKSSVTQYCVNCFRLLDNIQFASVIKRAFCVFSRVLKQNKGSFMLDANNYEV